MKSRILKTISMIVAIIFILSACSTEKTNTLSASGTFSAVETDIASEISGKVLEVGVNEGDEIKTGQTLFKVDAEIIQAQYDQATAVVKAAEAAVDVATKQAASADAQYQLVLQNALLQEQPNKQENWGASAPEDYQPAWYFDKTELIAAAQAGVKNAEEALATALADLEKEQKDASSKDFISTENRLAVAQNELTVANATLDQINTGNNDDLKDAATKIQETAQAEFESALAEYKRLLNSSTADAIIQARSRVAVAQTNLDNARNILLSLQTGDQSLQVVSAKMAAEAAYSGLNQAKAMLEQAQQAQKLAKLQLDRTTINSPISGVVLTRNLEIGDLAVAGGTVMRIAQLDSLDLVVYLLEAEYGKVKIGDSVSITVDSFKGEVFKGTIINIANEAEFTPRNVQTESGRKATVYAVKIQVKNLDHRLKPGMPADVEFSVQ